MAAEGWDDSAEAWIRSMGERGDWGREFVLDPALLARVSAGRYRRALDVGCGEGRLCRKLRELGITPTGLDPTRRLLEEALRRDPSGDYRLGVAERLPFAEGAFELVVSCLSLIDIEGYRAAIGEMNRVLAPGGTLLVANLASFITAGAWEQEPAGDTRRFTLDGYLDPRSRWEEWRGIAVLNWHRPLSDYFKAFLAQGLTLSFFDEPAPVGGEPAKAARYRRVPWYVVMEWRKGGR